MQKNPVRRHASSLALVIAAAAIMLAAAIVRAQEVESHYWDLGVGAYGSLSGSEDTWSNTTDLDKARMDWLTINFGSYTVNPDVYNRQLRLNPRLKYLVRLWPINNLGWKENRYKATFLDYLYKPGVKEKLLAETSRQIRLVLDGIDRPENVLGFTFLEELPGHFADNGLVVRDPDTLPWGVEKYKDRIAADLGANFQWDERARLWWGSQYAKVLNEINSHIKRESGDKWVFIWLQTNHVTLDWAKEGETIIRRKLVPFYWRDVIRPGVADGFFAYPNGEFIWNRYLALAKENNWLFFSQLMQRGGGRLASWETSIRLAETRVPQNLGYFLFITGDDDRGEWNADPSIRADDNFHPLSIRSHYRKHLAQRNVNMEIVRRHLSPEVQLGYDVSQPQEIVYTFHALVRNMRDPSWFAEPDDAVLRDVRVTLSLPSGMGCDPKYSPPATVTIERMDPGELRQIIWWPSVDGKVGISEETPVIVTVAAPGMEPVTSRWTGAVSRIEPDPVHEVRRSGESWYYPVLGRAGGATIVRMQCLRSQATMPTLQVNGSKAIFLGTVLAGQTLVIGPGRKASLIDQEHPQGRDVTDRLGGNEIRVKDYDLNPVTYTDMDLPSSIPKVRVTIMVK